MDNINRNKAYTLNSGLVKVADQCFADPEVSGWLIKHWLFALVFVVKSPTSYSRKTLAVIVKKPQCKH